MRITKINFAFNRSALPALYAVAVALLCAAAGAAPAQNDSNNRPPEAPTDLLVDLLPEPLGLENLEPPMGWIVNDADPNERQTAYQILVSDSPDRLNANEGNVWDSGKVNSSESSNVRYGGSSLQPDRIYHWKIRTWDVSDREGPFSERQRFTTGLKDRWTATPIWASQSHAEQAWTDYTAEINFTILENGVGLWLRHKDDNNAYLWQIFIRQGQAKLRPHVLENGRFTLLKEVPLDVEANTRYRLKVEIEEAEFRTYLNGQLVDTTIDDTHEAGTIGFRHGSTEQGRYSNLHVYDPHATLLRSDFSNKSDLNFTGGRLAGNQLHLDRNGSVLYRSNHANDEFIFLRKKFDLPNKEIATAIAHVTALSPEPASQYVYKLYVNDDFVGAGPERGYAAGKIVAPGTKASTSDPAVINRYNAFDVTELLRSGQENVVGAFNYTTADKRFLFQMRIQFTDGTHEIIQSDGSWKGLLAGNSVIKDLGNSGHGAYHYAPREGIDANHFPFGWNTAGFDDSDWKPAEEKEPITRLTASATRNTERHFIRPESIIDKGNGTYFIDFGKAVVAGLQLHLNGIKGHPVEIRFGEELSAPQTVRHQMRTRNTYQETWTLKDGPQTLENWGYRVFRYVEILNAPGELDLSNIGALALRQPFDDTASHFASSDSVLNDVWDVCKYSLKAVSLDMYVDTHTRERLNYEGDAVIHQLSDYSVDRDYAFPRFSIEHLYHQPTWPTEYKQQSVMMAWQDYMYTGNSDSLKRHYDLIKTKTLEEFINEDYLVEKESVAGGQRGRYGRDKVDWPRSELDGFQFTDINTVINAFNYKAISHLADIARVVGKDDDAARYAELADKLRHAMNAHLYDPAAGKFRDGEDVNHHSLHASAFPLGLGAVDPEHLENVADYVASRGMSGSVYLAQFLLDGLYLANKGDAALNLLNSTGLRSWGNMIYNLNSTIVGEAWDPSIKGNMSFSHTWATAPANVIPRGMFGVVPLEPGFDRFQIKPQPATLDWGTLTVPSIKGSISVAFKRDNERVEMTVQIPVNTQAKVYIPTMNPSSSAIEMNGQTVTGRIESGYVVLDNVGSGRHTFTSERHTSVAP